MGIEGGEASSAREILVVLVRDVVVVLEHILLGQSEVNHVNFTGLLAVAHNKVVRFDISVYKRLVVDKLDAFDHLVPHHESGLEVELLPRLVEQIFQRFAAQVHHHHVVLAFGTYVIDVGEAVVGRGVLALQGAQYFALVEELRAFGGGLFQLDRIFGVILGVEGEEDLPEGPRAQLLRELVVLRDYLVHIIIR